MLMSQLKPPKTAAQVPMLVQAFSKLLIKLLGWQIVGDFHGIDKCVIITRHTSNWDGIFSIFGAFSLGIRPRWIGKHQLFRGMMGSIMRWAGGIEVSRSQSANIVDQVAARFAEEQHLWLFIAPEGTRHKVDYWKTGFYYIALKADVPIVHGYLDYAERKVGVGTRLQPSGNIHADMEIIRTWFVHTKPKFPENTAEIRLNPQEKS